MNGIQEKTIDNVTSLLMDMIRTPSFSREEERTADILENYLRDHGVETDRQRNNVWAFPKRFNEDDPVILLNSHHDTVRPNRGWSRDPFNPDRTGDVLYGLGSNDAGGPLVSLIAAFLSLHESPDLPFNLVLALTAEEEISGENGIATVLPKLPDPDLAIVGEPSGMRLGTAERGHMVLECTASGVSGHAARDEGVNAIDLAHEDIRWLRTSHFPRESDLLGDVKLTVTEISAGIQHNVIPDQCTFTVDVRVPDSYTNDEIFETIQSHLQSTVTQAEQGLTASRLPDGHPLFHAAQEVGIETFVSPTSSDQGLMDFPSVKIGPGESERSHTADEFIRISEIEEGIEKYIELLRALESNAQNLWKSHWLTLQ